MFDKGSQCNGAQNLKWVTFVTIMRDQKEVQVFLLPPSLVAIEEFLAGERPVIADIPGQ